MISVDPQYVHTLRRKPKKEEAVEELVVQEEQQQEGEGAEAASTATSPPTASSSATEASPPSNSTESTSSTTTVSPPPPTSSSTKYSPSLGGQGLPFVPHPFMAPWMFIPPYLEVNYPTCSTVFLRSPLPQPDRVEVPSPLPPSVHQLGFEWYNTIKRRKTKRVDGSPLVVNGKTVMLKPKFDRMVRADQHKARYKRLGKLFNTRKIKIKYNPRFIKK